MTGVAEGTFTELMPIADMGETQFATVDDRRRRLLSLVKAFARWAL